ncbi:MAG: carbohydrate ABC transporter permease [Thermomicrobiales bacterium]|nr:carbohydrate ABC transporter permease [Thermomicrobiales bacterium]
MQSSPTVSPLSDVVTGNRSRAQRRLRSVGRAFALTVVILLCLLPVWYLLSTSFMTRDQFFQPDVQWYPDPFTLENFRRAFRIVPLDRYAWNTLQIELVVVPATLISASMVAYAFARLRWPGRDKLFLVLLATLMLPPQVTLIPLYVIFRHLGWIDTWIPLMLPAFLGGNPFYIFLIRQFMKGIPAELSDAARLDGAGELRVFWSIILPLCKPVLAAVAIFTFIATWNDFFNPLVYLQSEAKKTFALGLSSFTSQYGTDVTALLAATTLGVLPPILLFAFALRYFVEGITFSGTKG